MLLVPGAVRAEFDQWEKIGPRGGGVFCVAIHPTSLDTIYAALEEGVYRSVDAGENWSKLTQLPAPGDQVVFDPQNPNVIYAWSGYKLHKSYDCGSTWTQITSFYGLSFAVDQSHPNRLYVGPSYGMFTFEANVYVSTDGGVSWTETKTGSCCFVSALAVDPSDSNIVYAGTAGGWDYPGNGVYKTTDGCLTWEEMSSGLPYSNVSCLEIDPSDPLTLYAGTSGGGQYGGEGVFKTTDGGVTWVGVNTGLPFPGWELVNAIRLDPHRPETLYVSVSGCLFKSVNGGTNWVPLDMGIFQASINSIDFFPSDTDVLYFGSGLGVLKSASGGEDFTQSGIIPITVSSVVVDHEDSETIYATGRGTFKSTDSGAHWQPINKGLPLGQVITQDPRNNQVLYLGSYSPSGAVFKTANAGSTWGKTSLVDVAINDITVDPANPDIVFAGGIGDLFVSGVFKSVDGGATWATVDQAQASCIAIDPKNPAIVYAAGHYGLRKSVDGGTTWFPIENGLNLPESGYVLAIVVDPHRTNVLYCGTYNAGVFKSVDGGAHWENASIGIPPIVTGSKDIRALLIDPTDTNILYAGTWGNGVFVTGDGGSVWHRLGAGSGSSSGLCLALDPYDPNVIYSAGGGLWRYTRTTSCAIPDIISYSPPLVNSDNCADGCVVSFDIDTQDDCSEIAVVALERRLDEKWIHEDDISPPIPDAPWTLTCTFDEHFTDGEHEFRAVVRCKDGSRAASESVIVTADRGLSVTISGFEAGYSDGRVTLRWRIGSALGLRGFNVYRSLQRDSGFHRLNEMLIPAESESEYVDGDLEPGLTYWYRVGAVDTDGEWFSTTTSVLIPSIALTLFQNYPNPFNPSTAISFKLPEKAHANLSIFNLEGRLVKTLVNDTMDEGFKEVTWEGTDTHGNSVSSGVYFYRLKAGDKVLTRKMILLR